MFHSDRDLLDMTNVTDEERMVSTGRLPIPGAVRAAIAEAHELFRDDSTGANAAHYPALAEVDPRLYGIAVAATNGELYSIGDAETSFTIMSIAKPFVLALVCEAVGTTVVRERVGVNATGYPFDSSIPIEIDRSISPIRWSMPGRWRPPA